MLLIFGVSSIPGSDLPTIPIQNIDKIAHLAEYAVLGFLLIRAVSVSFSNISIAKTVFSAIIIASLFAVLDEWHQAYVPGRECDIFDLAADFIGACIGVALYRMKG